MGSKVQHLSVLLDEAIQGLVKDKNGIYVDCTFGRGGHSSAILQSLNHSARLIAIDRDSDAINSEVAQQLATDKRFKLKHASFSQLQSLIAARNLIGQVDGVLMDLGVSSPQLDVAERGFSFLRDGPLDMRMDTSTGLSAQQWLAEVEEQDLIQVLFDYGEERFARRIARAVIEQRQQSPINSTRQLATLIENAIPVKEKHKHPATRSFQAIRIAVNEELDELKQVLQQAVNVLKPGGRLVVISFHSLEDRIVKRFIRDHSRGKYNPSKLPLRAQDEPAGRLIKIGGKGKAGPIELINNPRARSAVMRIAERSKYQ